MSHRVALGGGWSVWSWACLRATGFPAHQVLELASDELARAVDQLLDQEAEVARRRATLIAACRAAAGQVGSGEQATVQRALKRLWQHRVPEPIAHAAAETARQALCEADRARDALAHAAILQYPPAQRRTSQVLRQIAGGDRFRQALLWQNRAAVTTGVDWLLRQPISAADNQTRKNERLVASYLQRYCVKNDTIGFFGPVGWARLVDRPGVVQRPGPSLVAERTVYFEYWAIAELAARLSADPALRPFLAPRLLPRFRLDGKALQVPIDREVVLPAAHAAALARCDGVRTARELARELVDDPALGLADEAAVLEVLGELAGAGVVAWALEIPTAVTHPEQHLAGLLARIDDAAVRRRAEAVLDELRARRAGVAAASSAPELEAALVAFDGAFSRATDAASRRAHGQTYAGRTPLYEDCRRDLEVALGRPLLDRLAAPLGLLLHSARWFTYEIAARYRAALAEAYRRLRGEAPAISFARFWQAVPALFPGGAAPGSIVAQVREELRRRWAAILAIDPQERVVQRRAAALAGAVARAFQAPCPGWPAARHHSPDVMIAAAGAQALERGELALVIGELHTGFCTVFEPLFVKHHPRPGELITARDADLDRVCVAPVWSKAVTRGDYYSMSPRDLDLEVGDTRSARPRAQVLQAAELVVEEVAGALEVRTRDGARRFDVIAFLEHHLIAESYAQFSPIAPAAWTPRVIVDEVVVARATWRVAPDELAWLALKEPAERFIAALRWARALGLPRWVFVKTPEEVKPVFVDFDSTVYVEVLAKLLRGASGASVSEMLPSLEQTWITDAAGARYTGELRICAVDPEPWRPAR